MTIDAKVLRIEGEKTLFGILDGKGECGGGSCEGCRCSTGMRTISLPTDKAHPVREGMRVEIHQNNKPILHFLLIILLPLLVLLGIQLLPRVSAWAPGAALLNGLSLAGGTLCFFLASGAVFLAKSREEPMRVVPKEEPSGEESPEEE